MPIPLQVTTELHVTPLIDIRSASFATSYAQGVYWCLYGEHGYATPLPDRYFVKNLQAYVTEGYFDGRHEHCLPFIGFYLGMIHGGVLTRRGQLRHDVATLVRLQHQQVTRGYSVGREWYFYEATPQEQWQTDTGLLEHLRELASEYRYFRNQAATLYWSFGCTLGELSGHLFPKTTRESQAWEAERQKAREAYEQEQAQREQYHTEQVGHA